LLLVVINFTLLVFWSLHTQAVEVKTKEDNDMSIIRKAVCALVVLSVLAFQSVSHAETQGSEGQPGIAGAVVESAKDRLGYVINTLTTPVVDLKEVACLARNIFFEAANEPEEGKVAVGLVTINRSQDPRFPSSVCGVVDQKVTRDIAQEKVFKTQTVWGTKTETQTVWSKLTICQFSWRCMFVKNPKSEDERWIESQRVALELLADPTEYADLRVKYDGALYFHATAIRPVWAKQKKAIGRVGGHWFYQEPVRVAGNY
jgi:spore germination cell wall hydrolase CwlJ-like protein